MERFLGLLFVLFIIIVIFKPVRIGKYLIPFRLHSSLANPAHPPSCPFPPASSSMSPGMKDTVQAQEEGWWGPSTPWGKL